MSGHHRFEIPTELPCDIEEESFIDRINDIADGGSHASGECRGNVSFWNPGDEYKRALSAVLDLSRETNVFDYRYSYSLQSACNGLPLAFGMDERLADRVTTTITPCSSASVVLLLQFLKTIGVSCLDVVKPFYFSVRPVSSDLGLSVRYTGIYDDLMPEADAVWVTSPVYDSGALLPAALKDRLHRYHDEGRGILVFDESFCLPGNELCREFPPDERTFFIYSPHKAISLNSFKFSAIVLNKPFVDFFDNRAEMYVGALSNSSIEAVAHYLGGNYRNECLPVYRRFAEERSAAFSELVTHYDFVRVAPGGYGHYRRIQTDMPLPCKGDYIRLLEDLYAATGNIFYPADVADFAFADSRIAFRVNLFADQELYFDGTRRILDFLGGRGR